MDLSGWRAPSARDLLEIREQLACRPHESGAAAPLGALGRKDVFQIAE
jgi:hypothetical protein